MNYVYLLRCADGSLYCGWTTNPAARARTHNSGKGAKYTRSRLPAELVYWEACASKQEALSREWHLKRLPREEKLALIEAWPAGVPLRPHHGMCFQFYEGKGYSADFTDHMGGVIRKLSARPESRIILTVGPDPVCSGCPNNSRGVCATGEKADRYDAAVLRACGLRPGDSLAYGDFLELVRTRVLDRGLRGKICGDCCWNALCQRKQTADAGGHAMDGKDERG